MTYKAIKEIGGYKVGEIVPDEEALLWLKMYSVPHVEFFNDVKEEEQVEENPADLDGDGKIDLIEKVVDTVIKKKQSSRKRKR